jgi:hypothetical protein
MVELVKRNIVGFGGMTGKGVYVTDNTGVIINTRNAQANSGNPIFLNLKMSGTRKDGTPLEKEEIVAVTSTPTNRLDQEFIFQLEECFVQSMTLTVTSDQLVAWGALFATVSLKFATVSAPSTPIYMELASGYVASSQPLYYAGNPREPSTWNRGRFVIATVTNPALGTPATFTVPLNTRLEINTISFKYNRAGASGNSSVFVAANRPIGTEIFRVYAGVIQGAGTLYGYLFAPFMQSINNATALRDSEPFPKLQLRDGDSITISADTLGTLDQIQNIYVGYEDWFEAVTAPYGGGAKSGTPKGGAQ